MDRAKKTLVNLLSSAAGYIVPSAVVFVTTPLLIHLVGKAAYGIQGLSNTVLGYFLIMDMNMDMALIKFLAEDTAKNDTASINRLLNVTLKIYLVIGMIGMLIIALCSNLLVHNVFIIPTNLLVQANYVFLLTACGFFASSFNMWIRGVAIGLQRYDYANTLNIFSNLFGNGLGILSAYWGGGVVGFTFFKVVSAVVISIAFFFFMRKQLPSFKLTHGFDLSAFKRILGFTSYGVLLRISGLILGKLDVLFIGMWIGAAAAGIYSIPFLIYSTLSYLIANMFHFLFPMSSELFSINKFDELRQIFVKLSKSLTILAVMLYLPIIVFGKIILQLWVGAEIAENAGLVLFYLAIAGFLGTIFVANVSTFIVGIGNVKLFTIYSISKGLFSCGLFFFFIKKYGIDGAGITLVISTIFDFAFLVIALKKYIVLNMFSFIKKVYAAPVCAGLLSGVVFFFLKDYIQSWWSLICFVIGLEFIFISLGYPLKIFGDVEKKAIAIIAGEFINLKEKHS